MTEDFSFHLLPGDEVNSILPLYNERFLCTANSGTLQMIDLKKKTASFYMGKYKGKEVQCCVPFPDFDEYLFPLVLIKEWQYVVIFNIKLKHYV